ncbi:hypothetical protein ALC57_09881 [Trachymyrmex cornetzi]|uniref:Uncharacterized protein n=1 Tax=Trachymyrmex cornetzi TaxID=471704 RepID=A0A151J4Y7_9HYME|nr:hypothetical protein ALC57_09881 [Trachymyrmex cornetzi]
MLVEANGEHALGNPQCFEWFKYMISLQIDKNFLTLSEKYYASWLSAYHHELQSEDETILYSMITMVKRLIIMTVIGAEENDDNKALVYVEGLEKHEWLVGILGSDDLTIESLDADYEDIDSLRNIEITNVCDVENVLRIVRNRMYLKCTTGGRNARKKYIKFKKNKV